MAIAIQASPTRLADFKELQPPNSRDTPRVGLIQDVRTRWNSTLFMLIRAIRTRPFLEQWCRLDKYSKFAALLPARTEWAQMEHTVFVLKPFRIHTESVSKANAPAIQSAFVIYDDLFGHVEESIALLTPSRARWKTEMVRGLNALKDVLQKYYRNTSEKGLIYNIATILDPAVKLTLYEMWPQDDIDGQLIIWRQYYQQEFEEFYARNYARYEDRAIQGPNNPPPAQPPQSAQRRLAVRLNQPPDHLVAYFFIYT